MLCNSIRIKKKSLERVSNIATGRYKTDYIILLTCTTRNQRRVQQCERFEALVVLMSGFTITNKDRYQSTSARRALAFLNSSLFTQCNVFLQSTFFAVDVVCFQQRFRHIMTQGVKLQNWNIFFFVAKISNILRYA